MDIDEEGPDGKIRLLNDLDEISARLSDCKDEWDRTHIDNVNKRKGARRIIDQLEPEMMEMAFGFGRDVCKDLRLYLGTARELLDRSVDEWQDEWNDLLAECDQVEKDMHRL